jgi:type 1 glutamine amidotransferase
MKTEEAAAKRQKPVKLGSSMFKMLLVVLFLPVRLMAAEPRVLVYQKNGKGFVHDNLAASAAAIRDPGQEIGLGVVVSTNPAIFADATLQKFQALIFANSNNEAFENDEQRAAFKRYIQHGGGFVGIHSSTGSEPQWPYFNKCREQNFFGTAHCRSSPSRFPIRVRLL